MSNNLIAIYVCLLSGIACIRSVEDELNELAKQYLLLHNEIRGKLRNGSYERQPQALYLPDLEWDMALQRRAESFSARCINKYEIDMVTGLNLGITKYEDTKELHEVRGWVNGRSTYKLGPVYTNMSDKTRVYTQMVWADTRFIGCSRQFCSSLVVPGGIVENVFFSVCHYFPRGNVKGQTPYIHVEPHFTPASIPLQYPPPEYYVKIHNDYRRLLRQGAVIGQPKALQLEDMTWDNNLAKRAATRAKMCIYDVQPRLENVGENMGFTTAEKVEPLHEWFHEHVKFRFKPLSTGENRQHHHYTQMIWYTSRKLGCARQLCEKFWYQGMWNSGVTLTVCLYEEKGNQPYRVPYRTGLTNRKMT